MNRPRFKKDQRVLVAKAYKGNYEPVPLKKPVSLKISEIYYAGCFGFRYDVGLCKGLPECCLKSIR